MAASHTGIVRSLQEWLRAQGRGDIRVDGIIGPRTRDATNDVGGTIGDMLLKEVDSSKPKPPSPPPTSSSRNPEHVAMVKKYCQQYGVSFPYVDKLVAFESGWISSAANKSGATGLFQLTKWPFLQWNVDHPSRVQYDHRYDRHDVAVNIHVGVWYITYCAQQMRVPVGTTDPADWALIYGAYNLGPGAMRAWRRGEFGDSELVKAWKGQASALRAGGISRYTDNAENIFA